MALVLGERGHVSRWRQRTQTDTRPIRHGPDGPVTAQAVANYLSRYATKSGIW